MRRRLPCAPVGSLCRREVAGMDVVRDESGRPILQVHTTGAGVPIICVQVRDSAGILDWLPAEEVFAQVQVQALAQESAEPEPEPEPIDPVQVARARAELAEAEARAEVARARAIEARARAEAQESARAAEARAGEYWARAQEGAGAQGCKRVAQYALLWFGACGVAGMVCGPAGAMQWSPIVAVGCMVAGVMWIRRRARAEAVRTRCDRRPQERAEAQE